MTLGRLIIIAVLSVSQTFAAKGSHIIAEEAINIGGIKQWISIRGDNERNPVLLFLHGGPGSSAISYADRFTSELQKHFIIVFWDQRETGKTKSLNTSPESLTLSRFEQDAVEVIQYLKTRFHREKIFLMGHSWGGFLGMLVASKHAELVAAYIAVSPMINQLESERRSLEWMKGIAEQRKNVEEMGELAKVKIPFENGEQLFFHRKWLAISMGSRPASKPYVITWSATWLALFNEASRINFITDAPEIHCPIYFFVGSTDYQTNFKITEDYFNRVKADKKELFWFTKSAHLVNLTEPGKMQKIIIETILPLTPNE